MEPVDSEDLYEAAARIDANQGSARAVEVLDFASSCMTKVGTELKSARVAFERGALPKSRKHPEQVAALLKVRDEISVRSVASALECLRQMPGVVVHRRELLFEMLRSLRLLESRAATGLEEAAWFARNMTRQRGRERPTCAVGTTLLVKGLEFDHAIVLNADEMDARNLYVAMTRGSRSLTVVSKAPLVSPKTDSLGKKVASNKDRQQFDNERRRV